MSGNVGNSGSLTDKALDDNSSSASIPDSDSFTGQWTKVPVGSLLTVDLKADVDLTLTIQYSVDGGTTTDSTLTRYYRTAFIFPPQLFKNARPYVRVVVTNNSGGATSTLRLNTYISEGEPLLNIPLDGTMSKDYNALSTRPTSFFDECALGRRQGWETWHKFGYNLDVDAAAPEVISSWGGTFARMTTADTLSIVSTSAQDGVAGTGVTAVVVYGIDENRDQVTAVYTMNGTTPVVTTGQNWLGVNRIAIYTCGTNEQNAGTITATATTATSIQGQMPVTQNGYTGGVSQQCIFHIPRDYKFLASYLRFNVNKLSGSSPIVTLRAIVYSAVNGAKQQVWAETIDTSVLNIIDYHPEDPFLITEKTILYFEAVTNTNNTLVSGRFGGKLVRDVDA